MRLHVYVGLAAQALYNCMGVVKLCAALYTQLKTKECASTELSLRMLSTAFCC